MTIRAWLAVFVVFASAGLPYVSAAPRSSAGSSEPLAQQRGNPKQIKLKIRRLPASVQLVVENVGSAVDVTQTTTASGWVGRLTTGEESVLAIGAQSVSLPDAGIRYASLTGSGRSFEIYLSPSDGRTPPRAVVSNDGSDLILAFPAPVQASIDVASTNLRSPTRVSTNSFVPPLQPRAIAPPVGDMAVGSSVIKNPNLVNLQGPKVSLVFRQTQARQAFETLLAKSQYGYVWVQGDPTFDPDQGMAPMVPPVVNTTMSASTQTGLPTQALVQSPGTGSQAPGSSSSQSDSHRKITLTLKNLPFGKAFNALLFASGMQATLEDGVVYVGPDVQSTVFTSRLSKVYRLNQASANAAADYLANLGAKVSKTFTVTTAVSEGANQNQTVQGGVSASTTTQQTQTSVEIYGADVGPLVGLLATTDDRLQAVTMIGSPEVVSIAEGYLKKLDLRQRQVALSVRILDVDLSNAKELDNSFALRFGTNFIVNDQGRLLAAFGADLPANSANFNQTETVTQTSQRGRSGDSARTAERGRGRSSTRTVDLNSTATTNLSDNTGDTYELTDTYTTEELREINDVLQRTSGTIVYRNDVSGRYELLPIPQNDGYRELTETNASNISRIVEAITGRQVSANRANSLESSRGTTDEASRDSSGNRNRRANRQRSGSSSVATSTEFERRPNPGLNYQDQQFYDFLQAQIVSSTAKILAAPTLILNEYTGKTGPESPSADDLTNVTAGFGRAYGNEGLVFVGSKVFTSCKASSADQPPEPSGEAVEGLSMGARVIRIDDNGFVTVSLTPSLGAPNGTLGTCNGVEITKLFQRRLDTGSVRIRDGQTLILTGVISEEVSELVSKWPILGDMPLIGQFFRRTIGDRRKRELVIMLSPRILNDVQGGTYGYGYQPDTQAGRSFVYGEGG